MPTEAGVVQFSTPNHRLTRHQAPPDTSHVFTNFPFFLPRLAVLPKCVTSLQILFAKWPPTRPLPTTVGPRKQSLQKNLLMVVSLLATFVWMAPAQGAVTAGHPAPEALPPVKLPDFRQEHPRLPHPSPKDIERIKRENPAYIKSLHKRLAGSKTRPQVSIEVALFDPGSVDLSSLHAKLMALKFTARGSEQVKPLATAYDWLYHQWTPRQREALLQKLIQGCEFQINFIRRKQLSPYNVYLYNSPFQSLVGCAIASYGDHPRAEPVMRFTRHLWLERVVPVWGQVMGENGGWHEGKEYVGIGIGDAIYQVPAMWRTATGEDLFRELPGIRGFLDFLLYRQRPDGELFRMGDGSFFTTGVPDQRALALEFGHAAAFTNDFRHPRVEPTAWPWGPLPDPSLADPKAIQQMPLSRLFDGIGVLIARSGWGPDDSYVWFKAGDNYWSHTHLDVGHFDIYKGGALALDSGFNYGVGYGSDHHMNYSYQSIAHNVITVTDPQDRVPKPGDPPRAIANDGGQRRIGSGWSGQAAPISLAEWQAQEDTYETATILGRQQIAGIELVSTDLTAAFTKARSGKGNFNDRTRRVERWYRSFGYDPLDEVVVVFDHIRSTRPEFRKRWLLHSSEAPRLKDAGFEIQVAAGGAPGRLGGTLQGTVLWPIEPNLTAVGGPGKEFWVDGKNYDDDGRIKALVARKHKQGNHSEPGAWRIELAPSTANADDDFLVVMLPRLTKDGPASHQIRRLESSAGPAVEVVGPRRTTRWYFDRATGLSRVLIHPRS